MSGSAEIIGARSAVAWQGRWRTRLLTAFLVVSLAVSAVELLDVAGSFTRAREVALAYQAETASSLAVVTEFFVARYLALAETAARAVGGIDLDAAATHRLLESVRAANPEVGVLFLTDAAGRLIDSTGEPQPPLDLSDRPYFRAIASGAPAAVSEVTRGERTGRPGVAVAAGVRRHGRAFAGVVVFGLPIDHLAQAMAARLPGGAYPLVVDTRGWVVVHGAAPGLAWEARDYSGLPVVAGALAGTPARSSGFVDPALGEGPRLGAMVPVERLGWAVGVFQPVDAALAGARQQRARALVSAGAVVALAVGLALGLSRWVGAPVAAERARARGAERALNEELVAVNQELQANTAQLEENLGELEATNQSLDEALAQVEAERQRLVTTLDSLPDAVLVADAAGTVVVANEAARRLLGRHYRAGLGLLGPGTPEPAAHWRGESRLAPEEIPLRRALRRGEATLALKLAIDGPEAGRRYVVATAVPVTTAEGQRLGAVTVMRDVTEQQTVEALKDQFIARASHELRTPLTAIRGTLRFLRRALEGTSRESPGELVVMAERNVEQMVRLIDDLLDASRLQTGTLALAPERLIAAEVLDRVAGTLGPTAREKEVTLRVEADPGLRVVADPLKLEQVLTNLVGNAVKFTPQGGAVTVVARHRAAEVEFCVRDTGPGLAPEHLARIFEPFYQVCAGGRPERSRGTGLGLTIAKGLVDLHGGRIWVESDGPGTGCTFVVRLPSRGSEDRAA